MRKLLRTVQEALERGEPVEMVYILSSGGSTPRGPGAVMAVFAGGASLGTIGGGNVEYEAQKQAAALLERGEDLQQSFRFVQGEAASLGMVCGGDVTLQFQYLSPEGTAPAVMRELAEAFAGTEDTWLVLRIRDGRVTDMDTADAAGCRRVRRGEAEALLGERALWREPWFALPVVQSGRTYIFGGGHVSRALVPLLASVGFRPVVYDDRAEFADPSLFPQAEEVLCGSFLELGRRIRLTCRDSVVVMTRGHQADYEVLTQVLRSGARYLGCIGSKRKLALCRERLLEDGFTEEEYARLHAPIGLAIGAQTPEEIAVSVAAEMIAVRAGVCP